MHDLQNVLPRRNAPAALRASLLLQAHRDVLETCTRALKRASPSDTVSAAAAEGCSVCGGEDDDAPTGAPGRALLTCCGGTLCGECLQEHMCSPEAASSCPSCSTKVVTGKHHSVLLLPGAARGGVPPPASCPPMQLKWASVWWDWRHAVLRAAQGSVGDVLVAAVPGGTSAADLGTVQQWLTHTCGDALLVTAQHSPSSPTETARALCGTSSGPTAVSSSNPAVQPPRKAASTRRCLCVSSSGCAGVVGALLQSAPPSTGVHVVAMDTPVCTGEMVNALLLMPCLAQRMRNNARGVTVSLVSSGVQ